MARVAFLGLGVMGGPMAGHLAAKGHSVTVYNRTASTSLEWVAEHGHQASPTPAEAVEGAEYVMMCVGNDHDVREVALGAHGAIPAMEPGSTLVDHTTASADVARELAAACAARGVGFVDAPVSGGQAGAVNGQLTVMCGSDEAEVFGAVRDVIMAYARECRRLGPAGAGQTTKMVNQICIAGLLQGLAEGVAFAQRAGLDVDEVVDTISKGAAGSWQMDNRARDDGGRRVRLRFRRRMDAQGPRDLLGRGRSVGGPTAGDRTRRPVLQAGHRTRGNPVGHQLARAAAAAALTLALGGAAGCSGSGDATRTTSLVDDVRELAEDGAIRVTAEPDMGVASEQQLVTELPLPDPATFTGSARVVNLWVGVGGEHRTIDVWSRRTFANGPLLLVDGIGFGDASVYFAAPPDAELVVVGAGAGPDGLELARLDHAAAGERVTTVFTNADEFGSDATRDVWEADPAGTRPVVDAPAPGMGVVHLAAVNTSAFGTSLEQSVGDDSFAVGDGSGACVRQRVQDAGFAPELLGGGHDVELELPPGPATITLHPWFRADQCQVPAALEVAVEVPVDQVATVLVYSPDGSTIEALQLPAGS